MKIILALFAALVWFMILDCHADKRHAELITRIDRLTAIAVMDSARVDSLMFAHDYVWPKRGTK